MAGSIGLSLLRIVSSLCMKKCTWCKKEKPEKEYSKKSAGKLQSHCKECQREYYKKYYKANREDCIKASVKCTNKTRKEQWQKIASIKEVPCTDCGIEYPHYVMEFDHIKGKKIDNVSSMPGHYGWNTIQKEINKCEVVCANCHRERTWKRKAS